MPKRIPRDLSGQQLVSALCRKWNYHVEHQRGSHMILVTQSPGKQQIVVPNHKALRIRTLNGILRAVSEHKKLDRDKIIDSL